MDGLDERRELRRHPPVHLDDRHRAVGTHEELDVEERPVEPERGHQPGGDLGHPRLRVAGESARVLEPQEADPVRMHDGVGDADRGHPPAAHEPLEGDEHAVEQLLRDERPERAPLERPVVRRDGVDRGARLGERGGVLGGPVDRYASWERCAATGFRKNGNGSGGGASARRGRPPRTPGVASGTASAWIRRDASLSWQRMNAARPGPGSPRRSASTAARCPVASLDPMTPSAAGPNRAMWSTNPRRVESRRDRLPGKPDGEPLHDALVRQVQAVALPGAEDENAGDGVRSWHRP